jgi:hypothetical protein
MLSPILKQSPFLNELSVKAGNRPNLFIFQFFSKSTLFGSFICNRRLAIASEIAKSKASIKSRPDQSDCDAYLHLEAVAISKRIGLEGWGLSNLFIFFSSFRIYLIWFIYMQQETRNCIGNRQTMKASI